MRVVMFGEQSEDVVDGVGRSEGVGRGRPEAANGREGSGQDAVEAKQRENVGGGEQEAAGRRSRAVLVSQPGLKDGMRGG